MNPDQFRWIACPYCGESNEVVIDISVGEHGYIEDCQVCCRPIELKLAWFDGDWILEVKRDDD